MIEAGGRVTSRVLILKFGAIGDVVMALPSVYALHQAGAQIDWMCGAAAAPLLACYPWIRSTVVDDRAILTGSPVARARAIAELWGKIAGRRYDLCATLYYDTRYRVLAWPVRCARKVMFSRTDRAFRLNAGRAHADEYARILLGEEDTCRAESRPPVRPAVLPPSPLPAKRTGTRIGLVPGGASNMFRKQTLRWPVAAYVALTRALVERGYEVVLLGGPDDAWVRAEFGAVLEEARVVDAIGALSLPEVVAVCDSCDAVISHDTGPLHLAGLSRAAVLGLFGPTDPGSFLPRREGVRALWGGEGFACRPCYDGAEFPACHDNGCMRQITVGMVLGQMDALLRERAVGAPAAVRVVLPSGAAETAR